MKNDLLTSIGKQLNIPRTNDSEYICQIVYSVAGRMALASLWDHTEDENTISIQHVKNRITQIFDAYQNIYTNIETMLPPKKTDLADEIYSTYQRAGFFYHSPFKISPAPLAIASCNNLQLYRSCLPTENMCMSGLGFYSLQKEYTDVTPAKLFCLQDMSFDSFLENLLKQNEWTPVNWPDNSEFLRVTPPFNKGYWQKTPDKTAQISLARYGEPNKIFVFYRFYDNNFQQKLIPEWQLRDYLSNNSNSHGEYRRIATALLHKYNILPKIRVKENKNLMDIKLGYRLPPSEEEFFKLYSWPTRYNFDSKSPPVFMRKMSKQFYPIFKHELKVIGYSFEEELL